MHHADEHTDHPSVAWKLVLLSSVFREEFPTIRVQTKHFTLLLIGNPLESLKIGVENSILNGATHLSVLSGVRDHQRCCDYLCIIGALEGQGEGSCDSCERVSLRVQLHQFRIFHQRQECMILYWMQNLY